MSPPDARDTDPFARVARSTAQRIRNDSRLRRNLPGDGRLELDRALPFLFVYRRRPGVRDRGTDRLVTAFSAYLVADGDPRLAEGLGHLVETVLRASREVFGAFLLFEVWTGLEPPAERWCEPSMEVVVDPDAPDALAEELRGTLEELRIVPRAGGLLGCSPVLGSLRVRRGRVAPPELEPLTAPLSGESGVHRVGLTISPFFRHPVTGEPFPRVLQAFRDALAAVLERVLFAFALEHTSLDPPHPRALARRTVGRAARHVDRRLGEVARSFDTLMQVTPVNAENAWEEFRSGGCSEAPSLRYRPLHFDPESVKRRLFHVPIENVEDPLLAFVFREKQEELDRQITMLREIETDRFRHASVQLYGGVDDELLELAVGVLEALPPWTERSGEEEYPGDEEVTPRYVDAEEFARAARAEIDWYRSRDPSFEAGVEIRDDVAAGLIVSSGTLLVSETLRIPRERVAALLNHEVGTHLVTWSNGGRQPIQEFQTGLAGYDSLQEGLAVLSEYLVGGLTSGRMRVLAGRVVAVRSLLDGADFVETFRELTERHGFQARAAFVITLRVHRGGGLTKDAAYLEGLRDLLAYLRGGGGLDPLFVGKLGISHTEIVQELVLRGVLTLPAVKPRYMSDPAAMARLEECRDTTVMDLVARISGPST